MTITFLGGNFKLAINPFWPEIAQIDTRVQVSMRYPCRIIHSLEIYKWISMRLYAMSMNHVCRFEYS